MRIAAQVAADKERRPDQFCPTPRCLWRTGGGYCPRHPEPDPWPEGWHVADHLHDFDCTPADLEVTP